MKARARCYHTTAPVALALGGIRRMQQCLGPAFDHQFVSALTSRLPGIAEQGRMRHPRPRGLPVYDGAIERLPMLPLAHPDDAFEQFARPGHWPTSPTQPRLSVAALIAGSDPSANESVA